MPYIRSQGLNEHLGFTKTWRGHPVSQVVSPFQLSHTRCQIRSPRLTSFPSQGKRHEHRVTSQINTIASFSDQPCRSEELQPARGRSRWLPLRPWSLSSCLVSLWSACVDGPTSTEHPGDGELLTTPNLMNYRNGLISKKTETLGRCLHTS